MSKTVGILGGGQLGWMLSESIFKYGGTPRILANKRSLASDRVPHTKVASWSDHAVLEAFFDACDVVTIEVEHVDVDALEPFAESMVPSLDVIRLARRRIDEKEFLASHDFPRAWFRKVESLEAARALADDLEFPLVLKTAVGGYDGRGQFKLESRQDYLAAIDELGKAIDTFGIVLEEELDLFAEASVILARGPNGSVEFPVFENVHRNHILDTTHLPSALPSAVERAMKGLAHAAAEAMDLHGMLTTEFFVTRAPGRESAEGIEGYWIYINEFAPRPHNSGHISRNACSLSQFDALARVLLDLPPEPPALLGGKWCMANLLSDLWCEDRLEIAAGLEAPGIVDLVLYGKAPNRPHRKMGHVVARSETRELAAERALAFRQSASSYKS